MEDEEAADEAGHDAPAFSWPNALTRQRLHGPLSRQQGQAAPVGLGMPMGGWCDIACS